MKKQSGMDFREVIEMNFYKKSGKYKTIGEVEFPFLK